MTRLAVMVGSIIAVMAGVYGLWQVTQATDPPDIIRRGFLAVGVLLLAVIGVLVVIAIPERPKERTVST